MKIPDLANASDRKHFDDRTAVSGLSQGLDEVETTSKVVLQKGFEDVVNQRARLCMHTISHDCLAGLQGGHQGQWQPTLASG